MAFVEFLLDDCSWKSISGGYQPQHFEVDSLSENGPDCTTVDSRAMEDTFDLEMSLPQPTADPDSQLAQQASVLSLSGSSSSANSELGAIPFHPLKDPKMTWNHHHPSHGELLSAGSSVTMEPVSECPMDYCELFPDLPVMDVNTDTSRQSEVWSKGSDSSVDGQQFSSGTCKKSKREHHHHRSRDVPVDPYHHSRQPKPEQDKTGRHSGHSAPGFGQLVRYLKRRSSAHHQQQAKDQPQSGSPTFGKMLATALDFRGQRSHSLEGLSGFQRHGHATASAATAAAPQRLEQSCDALYSIYDTILKEGKTARRSGSSPDAFRSDLIDYWLSAEEMALKADAGAHAPLNAIGIAAPRVEYCIATDRHRLCPCRPTREPIPCQVVFFYENKRSGSVHDVDIGDG